MNRSHPMPRPSRRRLPAVIGRIALGLLLAAAPTSPRAQPAQIGVGSNFNLTDYYPFPNQRQMKFKLTGTEARPLPGEKVLLKNMKLQSFRPNGVREIVIEAPECLYDRPTRQAGSPGPLQVQSGDGRFQIAGDGFAWRQDTKSLIISNQIRSTIQQPKPNAAPLEITSRWFEFNADQRRGVFHDEVRGEDAEVEFTCGQLAASAPAGETFDLIEADTALEIKGKADGRRASAQRGVYHRTDGRVELIGQAAWRVGQNSGSADRVLARQADHSFEASGNVAMKLPREGLGAAGGLLNAGGGAGAPAAESPLVDLFSDRFSSRSNLVVAEGAVRLRDATNQLSCDRLEARSGADAPGGETAVATGHVVVGRGGGSIRAERAVYSEASHALVFTGAPQWQQAQIAGRAERVTVGTLSGEVIAENDVAVTLSVGAGGGSLLSFFPAADTNGSPQTVEVFSRILRFEERLAVFSGGVRAHQAPQTGGEPRLRSEKLEVHFAAGGRGAESLRAIQGVVYEQGAPGATNGPSALLYRRMDANTLTANMDAVTGGLGELVAEGGVRIEQPGSLARGSQAVYTGSTQILKLLGNPSLETPEVIISEANELIWDNARGTMIGTGYKSQIKPEVLKRAEESQKLP
jgi:lipopolysaccharide export system protein LptA